MRQEWSEMPGVGNALVDREASRSLCSSDRHLREKTFEEMYNCKL